MTPIVLIPGLLCDATVWLKGMVHELNQTNSELMHRLTEMVLRCDTSLHARRMEALTNRPDASKYLAEIRCNVLLGSGTGRPMESTDEGRR